MSSDRLRIAIFSDSALPILNGVSVSVNGLIGELRHQGHSVHLFTARYPGYRDPDPNTYRCRAIETPISRGYPVAYPPFYRMLQKFRRHEFDVIHTHTPFFLGMVGFRWAEAHDIPIVSTYHTLYDRYSHYFKLLPHRYVRFRIAKHTNFYYNHMDHVITPSEASLKWLVRHSVHTPTSVIPTGIPRCQMIPRSEARQALGIKPDEKVLLYVGRLAREKNLGLLLESAQQVFAKERRARLFLVGDGPFRQECVAMARALGIGDSVRFIGAVPRPEVDRFYSAADLFTFSSITETQGLVIQEAMTYGLPAIAVAGGGASASIVEGENGFVVKGDAGVFADTVLMVLNNDELHASMSEHAVRSVRNQGVEHMCDQVVEVYRSVIEKKQESSKSAASYAWI